MSSILSHPSFKTEPVRKTAAWFCMVCTKTKRQIGLVWHITECSIQGLFTTQHMLSKVNRNVCKHNMSWSKHDSSAHRSSLWYAVDDWLTFCMLSRISEVLRLPLANRSLSMLATDSSPALGFRGDSFSPGRCQTAKQKSWMRNYIPNNIVFSDLKGEIFLIRYLMIWKKTNKKKIILI